MTAMTTTAAPPTAPPTIAAVCELLLLVVDPVFGESPAWGSFEETVGYERGVTMVGSAALVPVGPPVLEFVPINAPAPISGSSKNHGCEAAIGKTEKKIPTTDGHRFEGIPKGKIFALS